MMSLPQQYTLGRVVGVATTVVLLSTIHFTQAFAPPTSSTRIAASRSTSILSGPFSQRYHPQPPHRRLSPLSAAAATASSSSSSSSIPNLFSKLPWNARKERERQARALKLERAKLHRQLGIAEDATYEEIVIATDALLAAAGDNLKEKIMVEKAKDEILLIRLNERLAGLATENKEARAMSNYEDEGADEPEAKKSSSASSEWSGPLWTRGLVVKPDEAHLKSQLRLWGILTALGAAIPPAQDYLGRFTWLVCVAQLTFRGMPREQTEGGGLGMNFNSGSGGGGHRKVAFALGFSTWVVGAILVYGMMPTWAKGQRWTSTVAFTMQNFVFGLVSCYLQPYKG